VCALVAFPSFALAEALRNWPPFRETGQAIRDFAKKEKLPVICWTIALAAAFIFGFTRNGDFSSYPSVNIALIQQNNDPWEATKAPTPYQILQSYRRDLQTLKRLSDEAQSSSPKPDLVVWAETAFVPRIYWHTTYRDDQDSWLLVRELMD
jgi:apolipoprotein N-acyltransferase